MSYNPNTVPVVTREQVPLMPTRPSRARRWIRDGKATAFFKRGVFCVRLNVDPSALDVQPIALGIDPGSKKEGFTIKSAKHTFLNVQADAVTHVKDAIETRRNMRKVRRFRKTPCRPNRMNRARGGIPPSTKARWQWKLRIVHWLAKMFPIQAVVLEDISAGPKKGQRRWNASFGPLQVGKQWFQQQLHPLFDLRIKHGWETAELRTELGLRKSKAKMSETFSAHCVDSWVLANSWTGGHTQPDNTRLLCITPLRFHRRQLHKLQPAKGGTRKRYGSTLSHGFVRGSIIKHPKWGTCYVGGYQRGRISLHDLKTGKRLCRSAKPEEVKHVAYNTWRARHPPARGLLPALNDGASAPGVIQCIV